MTSGKLYVFTSFWRVRCEDQHHNNVHGIAVKRRKPIKLAELQLHKSYFMKLKLEEQKEAKRAAPETRKGVVVLLKMHFSHAGTIKQNDTWASKIKYNVKLLMDFQYIRDG